MVKREKSELAIYRIEKETESLPMTCLRNLYLEKTSEIIYITKCEKLYGMICYGDVFRRSNNGKVQINRDFVSLCDYNVVEAHQIFQRKKNVHKIPVVNGQGILRGDYSRWDDMLYIERNQQIYMREKFVVSVLKPYEMVYVIEPVESTNSNYMCLLEYLDQFRIKYNILDKEQMGNKMAEKAVCIFLSEDEKRGILCLWHEYVASTRMKFITYRELLERIIDENQKANLEIEKITDTITEKYTVILSALKKKGIPCFQLYNEEKESTEFWDDLKKKIEEQTDQCPVSIKEPWPKMKDNEERYKAFYSELGQLEDYKNDLAQREIHQGCCNYELKGDISGKYFNSANGKRVTWFQPKEYIGTIYLLGRCTFMGFWTEDQYTISSLLQEILLNKGYNYRVENLGGMLRWDAEIDTRLLEIGDCYTNDIVIVATNHQIEDITGDSLQNIYERHHVPSSWIIDTCVHCNHQINRLIAHSMLDVIEPCLQKGLMASTPNKKIKLDIFNIMATYVYHEYLNRYFACLSKRKYSTIGVIVMECDPFNVNDQYLIERARLQVEFLIVIVLEESNTMFAFEERFKMAQDGTKGLSNVMVVPSGKFILSKSNFPEYFIKCADLGIASLNAEYDVNMFADYIARPLDITHRFAEEKPEEKIEIIYNRIMQSILPNKGIIFVEIPKMEVKGDTISDLKIRKLLKSREYDKVFEMVPETTKKYLVKQIY